MKKYSIMSMAGEVREIIYTHTTVGDASGIFTKMNISIDPNSVKNTYTDDQIETIIKNAHVDNLISMNGSFLKRVMKIKNGEDDIKLLYLNKYELNSLLTNSEEYKELAKETNAPLYEEDVQLVVLEEYTYILT